MFLKEVVRKLIFLLRWFLLRILRRGRIHLTSQGSSGKLKSESCHFSLFFVLSQVSLINYNHIRLILKFELIIYMQLSKLQLSILTRTFRIIWTYEFYRNINTKIGWFQAIHWDHLSTRKTYFQSHTRYYVT